MSDTVLRDLNEDGVLLLTLHRPERKNAWNSDMETAYFRALDDAAADPDVRAVVLTGHGTTFCPGMDMQRLDAASSGAVGTYMEGIRRPQTTALYFPETAHRCGQRCLRRDRLYPGADVRRPFHRAERRNGPRRCRVAD